MDEVQFADGIDAPDRLAFGLGAWQLLAVVAGALLAYAVLRSPLPSALALPLALSTAAIAAALGWLRLAGRPALDWAWFAVRFFSRPRAGTVRFEAQSDAAVVIAPDLPPQRSAVIVPLRPHVVAEGVARGWTDVAAGVTEARRNGSERESSRVSSGEAPAGLRPRTAAASVHPRAKLRVGGAHRITLFSLKGGTGRTMIASELACILAAAHPEERLRVALLDLDTRSPSLAVRLGIAGATVADYALAPPDDRHASAFMAQHTSGVQVMLGAPDTPASGWPLHAGVVRELLRDLDIDGFDIVIADVAAELSTLTSAVLTSADDVLVVVNATPGGVQDAYRTTEQLRRLGLRHQLRFVVNRARPGVDFATAMADLAGHVLAEIPEDAAVAEAEDTQRCVTEIGGGAADALHRLARRVRRELATPRLA